MPDAHHRSLRESWIILAAFAAVTVWVLCVCGSMGYREDRAIRASDDCWGMAVSETMLFERWVEPGEVFERSTNVFVPRVWGRPTQIYDSDFRVMPAGYIAAVGFGDPPFPRGAVLAAPVEDGPAGLATILGIPAWAFWGIMLPWVASTLLTVWFSLYGMADEEMAGAGTDPNDDARTAFPVKPAEAGHA